MDNVESRHAGRSTANGAGTNLTAVGDFDFPWLVTVIQEAAVVLGRSPDGGGNGRYHVLLGNDRAARALRTEPSAFPRHSLEQLLPQDAARELARLCDKVTRSGQPAECFASAPDPLTDLTGTPSTSIRVTPVGGTLLCTWVPGWHIAGQPEDRRMATVAGVPTADRLTLANAVDALSYLNVGVFSVNLMNGRYVASMGMLSIFGIGPKSGPIDRVRLRSLVEFDPVSTRAWRALIRHGAPMDLEVKLSAALGGGRVRLTAAATLGPDDHPTVIQGVCSLLDG